MNPRALRAHQPDLRPDPLDDPRFDPPTDFEVDYFEEYGLPWASGGCAGTPRTVADAPLIEPGPSLADGRVEAALGEPGLETAA